MFRSLVLLVLVAASSAHAQTPTPSPKPSAAAAAPAPSLERQFLKNLLRDQKAIWTSPFHARLRDVRWLAPLGASATLLIATDRRTGDVVAASPELLPASRVVSYAGSAYSAGGATFVFYVIGRATHDNRARETGLLGAEALINSAIVGSTLKQITQRGRPWAGEDRGVFFAGGSSFPSGHTIHAWAFATVVAHEYPDHRWVQVAAYGLAAAASLSRFTGQKHYLSDVFVGAALGYGIGHYVYRAHHLQAPSGDTRPPRAQAIHWPLIAPQYDRRARAYGLRVSWVY